MSNPRKAQDHATLKEIRDALERSGYVMESRLVRALVSAGYFVEPNQVICDLRTGKSREIDIVADPSFNFEPEQVNWDLIYTTVKTTLVIEAVNNRYPIVLLTERPDSINQKYEDHIKYRCEPNPCPFWELLLEILDKRSPKTQGLYTQYCVLSKKRAKDELMASHSEDTYGSLLKLAEYVENAITPNRKTTPGQASQFWSIDFWKPTLVVSGQLFTAKVGGSGDMELEESSMATLEFNWHADGQPHTTAIEIVIEKDFPTRTEAVRALDSRDEIRLREFRFNSSTLD